MHPGSALRGATLPGSPAPSRMLWILPWLVVVELVGSTYGAPLLVSLGYFAMVALATSSGPAGAAIDAGAQRARKPGHWLAGGLLLGVGVALTMGFLLVLGAGAPPRFVSSRLDIGLPLGLLGCWGAALGVAWTSGRSAGWRDLERFGLLLGLAFLALLASGYRVQGLPVFPSEGWARGLAVLLAVVVAGLVVSAGRWLAPRFMVLLMVGVAVRWIGLGVWKPDPAVRDMLPLAWSAGDALARGAHPYGLHQMQRGSLVPLTYLPGLWGLHDLPRLFGLPFRLSSLAADLTILWCFWWVASRRDAASQSGRHSLVLGLGAVWLLSPSVQWNFIYAEPHPWWGVMALTIASALRGRWLLSAVALGVAVATRQFAWFIAPFWALWLWRAVGPELAMRRVLVASGIALSLILPFAATAPDAFWFGTMRWFRDYGPAHRTWFVERLGFAGTLYAHGLEGWLMPVQAVVALGAFGFAWWGRTERRLRLALALGYTLFVMFGLVIWDSFYLGIFVLVSLVCLAATNDAAKPRVSTAKQATGPWPRWLVSVGALEVLGLLWLGYGFWATGSELGLREASSALARHLRPRDVALDASRPRVAFVQPPLALTAPGEALAVSSEFDPMLGEWGWLTAPRLGLLYRAGSGGERAERLSRLGASVANGKAGFFSWVVVKRGGALGRLSDGILDARLVSTDGASSALSRDEGGYRSDSTPWLVVKQRDCFVGGRQRRMLFAHPSDEVIVQVSFTRPREATRLLLVAGLEDRVVRWGLASVTLEVSIVGRPLGALEVDNAPGPTWNAFDIPQFENGSHVELALLTADDRQRWLCLEGLWLR